MLRGRGTPTFFTGRLRGSVNFRGQTTRLWWATGQFMGTGIGMTSARNGTVMGACERLIWGLLMGTGCFLSFRPITEMPMRMLRRTRGICGGRGFGEGWWMMAPGILIFDFGELKKWELGIGNGVFRWRMHWWP